MGLGKWDARSLDYSSYDIYRTMAFFQKWAH